MPERVTLRKKINKCRTNRQKIIQISRNVLSSQKKLIQINKNRVSRKKIKIVLPQHSKKQEKMTTKSKLEKKYKYSEMSLIQMSRLK